MRISIHSAIASGDVLLSALPSSSAISIHSAIASGDSIKPDKTYFTEISIHSAIASGDEASTYLVSPALKFQSTPPSLAETANSHTLHHTISNNHMQFAHISSNQLIQSSHFPSITAKFSVRTSQGFYDHFWFAP